MRAIVLRFMTDEPLPFVHPDAESMTPLSLPQPPLPSYQELQGPALNCIARNLLGVSPCHHPPAQRTLPPPLHPPPPSRPHPNHIILPLPPPWCPPPPYAGKVFKAVQAHWLSACMHVMLELRVADALVKGSSTTGQQGMHVDEVRDGSILLLSQLSLHICTCDMAATVGTLTAGGDI